MLYIFDRKKSALRSLLLCSILVPVLSSCSDASFEHAKKQAKENNEPAALSWLKQNDPIDPANQLSRDDYVEGLRGRSGKPLTGDDAEKKKVDAFPFVSNFVATPPPPAVADDKLVTIAVTEDVPLKDVLIELARRADVDIEIDPKISGGVIFRAKDRPFSEVVDRLSKMANLRYKIENGILKIERDTPYVVNYKFHLLNQVRKATSNVSTSTEIGSGGGAGGSGGASSAGGNSGTGSRSNIEAASGNTDIWAEVQQGIGNIFAVSSGKTPVIVSGEAGSAGAAAPAASGIPGQETAQEANILSSGILSLNRQAGILSVAATDREHAMIKEYLDRVHMAHSSQVLIEAKVLEVNLNDEYRSGIDWSFGNNNLFEGTATGSFSDSTTNEAQKLTLGILPAEFFGFNKTDLSSTVQFVEKFGTSRTLASPRVNAMNNQYATLSFVKNFVYFDINVEEETEGETTTGATPTRRLKVDSDVKTVPEGVILNLQPSIDLERNEVVMNVRPTISRIDSTVSDPAVDLTVANFEIQSGTQVDVVSKIPVVDVREVDSVLRMKSGEIMVIGGLMEETSENNDVGVPGLSRIPYLGNAFKGTNRNNSTIETVIFIKATIVPGEGVTVEDKNFYNRFTGNLEHHDL